MFQNTGHSSVFRIIRLESVDSTSTYAKFFVETNPVPGDEIPVVTAKTQTAGRGRLGRSFFSNVEGGLWVSLVLKPDDMTEHFKINRALCLSISLAVSDLTGLDLQIKWPNDLYCRNRKICGILLETAGFNSEFIIAGFGLNVNIEKKSFPQELHSIATSTQIETGFLFDTDKLLEDILQTFSHYLQQDDKQAHEKYSKKLYRKGDSMELEGIQGIFNGVEQDGRLILNTIDGVRHFVSGTPVFSGAAA